MARWELYQQVYLLKALYYSCRDAAEWDRAQDDYIAALEESRAKMRWLRDANRVKKEAWER
jgi:hypothetical protein